MRKKEETIDLVRRLLVANRIHDVTAAKYLRRPEVTWDQIVDMVSELAAVEPEVARQVECDVKYEGYIARQDVEIERQRRLADKRIPKELDYNAIRQLRTEAREKLTRIRPISLAQASRISGITPADLALLLTYLHADERPGV